jgi:predicted transcriptional regulator YheO
MQHNEIMKYLSMVNFIADICGPKYEVVLHDLSKPEKSVIAIRNNHISGRDIGSPITDLALKILKQREYDKTEFITNYKGYVRDGVEVLSSTYFIKNENSELIGMLCVNNDTSDIADFEKVLKEMMCRFNYKNKKNVEDNNKYEEHVGTSIVDLTKSLVAKTIDEMNIPPNRMSMEEKVQLVHEIDKLGVFLLKGGVSYVGKILQISEPTLYRYLHKERHR